MTALNQPMPCHCHTDHQLSAFELGAQSNGLLVCGRCVHVNLERAKVVCDLFANKPIHDIEAECAIKWLIPSKTCLRQHKFFTYLVTITLVYNSNSSPNIVLIVPYYKKYIYLNLFKFNTEEL